MTSSLRRIAPTETSVSRAVTQPAASPTAPSAPRLHQQDRSPRALSAAPATSWRVGPVCPLGAPTSRPARSRASPSPRSPSSGASSASSAGGSSAGARRNT